MRVLFAIYCVLALLFAGGCASLLQGDSVGGLGSAVVVAFLANAFFLAVMWSKSRGAGIAICSVAVGYLAVELYILVLGGLESFVWIFVPKSIAALACGYSIISSTRPQK
jgi:hypothetical protein